MFKKSQAIKDAQAERERGLFMDAVTKRVLFADDDEMLLDLLTRLAEKEFLAEMVCARSVSDARQLIVEQQFDAAILDQRLLNGTGLDIYRDIVNRELDTKVVFFTGYATSEVCQKIHEVGPALIIEKTSAMNLRFLRQLFDSLDVRRKVIGEESEPAMRVRHA